MQTQAQLEAAPAGERANTLAKVLVLFNEKAGSVTPDDRERLVTQLAELGVEQYALIGCDVMSPELFARAPDFDAIIVLGGDGTARTVAELAPEGSPPLILLPGGTLNLLPRALYGDLAWPEALKAAFERGVEKRLTTGSANGKRFFVAAMFGAPTLLARVREATREGKFLTAIRRADHLFKRLFSHKLRSHPEGKRVRKASAVGVLCPAFSGSKADAIDVEHLEWVRLDADDLLSLARVSLKTLSAAWRQDPTVDLTRCKKGVVTGQGVIPATLDGEPTTFLSKIEISYDPKGPRVLALESEA